MMPPAQFERTTTTTTTTQDTLEDMRAEVELYESPRPSDQTNQSSSSTSTSTSTSKTDSPTPPPLDERTSSGGCQMEANDEEQQLNDSSQPAANNPIKRWPARAKHEVRLLVRRREAGALIGKKGANIKRLREQFHESSFNIPDTGNGPERVVIIAANSLDALESILLDVVRLFQEKQMFQPQRQPDNNDPQVEMKMLINSSHAGLLIGVGGQSIRKLRNDTKAALKIYEMCCPHSSERVCAVKARPPVVVAAMRAIHELLGQSPVKGPHKAYDALNFELSLADKYGGYTCDDDSPPQFGSLPPPPPAHFEHHLMHHDHHVAHHLPAVVHPAPVTSSSSSPYLSQASHYLAAAAAAAAAAGSPFLRDSLYQPPARLLAAAAAAAAATAAAATTNRRPHASRNFCDRFDSSCPVRGGFPADRFHPYCSATFGGNRFQRNFSGSRNYPIARSEANKCRLSTARSQQQLRSSPGDNQPGGGGGVGGQAQVKHQ